MERHAKARLDSDLTITRTTTVRIFATLMETRSVSSATPRWSRNDVLTGQFARSRCEQLGDTTGMRSHSNLVGIALVLLGSV